MKPNQGHGEGAAGISSILKATLALEHSAIPPNINFSKLNSKIPFGSANITVPVELTPWPQGRAERASINSFGIGGANCHVILDSVASLGLSKNSDHDCQSQSLNNRDSISKGETSPKPALLVFSTTSLASLGRTLEQHENYASRNLPKLQQISYTLCNRRDHFSNRAYCVSDGLSGMEFSPLTQPKKISHLTYVSLGREVSGQEWLENC